LKNSTTKIIVNFLNNQSDIKELEFLLNWISDEDNFILFKQFISIHHYSNLIMNHSDKESIIREIKKKIKSDRLKKDEKKFILREASKYAAIVVVSICVGYYLDNSKISSKPINELLPSKISLQKSNGEKIILDESSENSIDLEDDVILKKELKTISYNEVNNINSLKFNTIEVPYGKRFNVRLSDNTLVFLNSGSSLKFPVKFIQGQERKVYLQGEAFFEVTHNKELFTVESPGAIATVYGTKFNFKNYQEDPFSEVILTEGSVGLKSSFYMQKPVTIKPNFKAELNKVENNIEVVQVNTKLYTSWIDGKTVFRNENIDNLILKLERLYNVSITNNNQKLSNKFFNATIFVENETIEDVLEYLKEVYKIDYQFINNKIVIK
tara:strand:- start:24122 stop:25267 length:1146 start_codon:yes stop_codon:yes gene_type:complete